MSIIRKIKEEISSTGKRALGLDGIRFNLQVALERLEKIYPIQGDLNELKAMSARIESMTERIEGMSAQINEQLQLTDLDHALRRLQGHQIEIASLIDVGASNGSWSKTFARYFPGRHHLLIEANELHLPLLTKVCQENPNWHYALAAVGGKNEELFFDASDPLGGHLSKHLHNENYRPYTSTTIDDLLAKQSLPGPYMIKLDTHGVEVPILTGSANALKQTNALVIEAYNFSFSEPAVPFWDLCRHLFELGYRPLDVFDLLHREVDNAFWQFDILFVRSDLPLFENVRFFVADHR
ncbi:MAG: FkbM family methyltransferase [Chthoniobacterales bacterium]